MSTTQTTGPDRPAAWLDEGEVNPEWTTPAGAPVHPSRVRRGLVYGSVLLSLALVLGLIHLAGGFEQRTDLLEPVAPGALIVTGPYELSFTEATAQARVEEDGTTSTWEIVVIGRARNTGDESMAPTTFGDDSVFVLRDLVTEEVAVPSGTDIGDLIDGRSDRRSLPPGLPAMAYRLTFDLAAGFRPGPTIRFGVAELVYETKYLTTDEKAWDNGRYGFRMDLPLRVLPPDQQ